MFFVFFLQDFWFNRYIDPGVNKERLRIQQV
jgi:hypothetical protein